MLEIGPKGRKVVAVAPDWPGLERGAKTEEDAIERLVSYVPRYSQVAKLAKMDAEFDAIKKIKVVEQYPGTGSTDFWGISFAFSSIDRQAMSGDELERELRLMQACWAFFDNVRRRSQLRCRTVREEEGVIGIISSVIRLPRSRIGRRRSVCLPPMVRC
jgi:hypothetical protein